LASSSQRSSCGRSAGSGRAEITSPLSRQLPLQEPGERQGDPDAPPDDAGRDGLVGHAAPEHGETAGLDRRDRAAVQVGKAAVEAKVHLDVRMGVRGRHHAGVVQPPDAEAQFLLVPGNGGTGGGRHEGYLTIKCWE